MVSFKPCATLALAGAALLGAAMPWRMASLAQHTDLGGKLPSVHLAAIAGCPDWPGAGSFWHSDAGMIHCHSAGIGSGGLCHDVAGAYSARVGDWPERGRRLETFYRVRLCAGRTRRACGWVCRRSLTAVLAGFGGDGRHSTDRHILAVGHPE